MNSASLIIGPGSACILRRLFCEQRMQHCAGFVRGTCTWPRAPHVPVSAPSSAQAPTVAGGLSCGAVQILAFAASFSPTANAHAMFGASWGTPKDTAALGMAMHAPVRSFGSQVASELCVFYCRSHFDCAYGYTSQIPRCSQDRAKEMVLARNRSAAAPNVTVVQQCHTLHCALHGN